MNEYEILKSKNISEIEKKLNYFFKDKNFSVLAFIHPSFVNENKDITNQNNERLEFLGDSILNLIISKYLFKKFPKKREGDLSFLRAKIVDAISCRLFLEKLDLKKYLLLGKGERILKRGKENILADLFEAIVGAIYLDGGFFKVENFLIENFKEDIKEIIKKPKVNYKEKLQNYYQIKYQSIPVYSVIKEKGPDHKKKFEIEVKVDGIIGIGVGGSKKDAEKQAAKDALRQIKILT